MIWISEKASALPWPLVPPCLHLWPSQGNDTGDFHCCFRTQMQCLTWNLSKRLLFFRQSDQSGVEETVKIVERRSLKDLMLISISYRFKRLAQVLSGECQCHFNNHNNFLRVQWQAFNKKISHPTNKSFSSRWTPCDATKSTSRLQVDRDWIKPC